MELDLSMIPQFFKNYGWQLGALALSGILVLGFLKWIGVFKHINKTYKKYIYFGISCALSIAACTIYLLVENAFQWANYAILCLSVIALTSVSYNLYECIGLRALVKIAILDPLTKLTKIIISGSLSNEQKQNMALSLGSETLTNLVSEAKECERLAEEKRIADEKAAEEKRLLEEQKKAEKEQKKAQESAPQAAQPQQPVEVIIQTPQE